MRNNQQSRGYANYARAEAFTDRDDFSLVGAGES